METLWTRTARNKIVPDTALPGQVDVAIIGGGFTGLTAARELAGAGRSVAVLEASHIGAGASGMNAGFVVPNFAKADPIAVRNKLGSERGDILLRLVGDAANAVYRTVEEDGIVCDARQTGWLNPAFGAAGAEMLKARAAMWRDLGRPVTFLSADEVREQTGMDIYSGALLDAEGGTIHPLDYVRGLAISVQSRGGTVHEGQRVDEVQRDNGGWRLIMRSGATMRAGKVLLCTNAFTTGAANKMGRSVVPLRVYQIATTPTDPAIVQRIAPDARPVGDTRQNLFTYRLDRDNRLISGGMAAIPLGAFARLGRSVAERLSTELGLAEPVRPEVVWTGTAAMTPDFLPRIYQMGDGYFGGIGCNGRGVAMTAQLGRVLARAAIGEAPESLPIPLRTLRPLPFHSFTPIVASAALLQARLKDRFSK
ncbi:FAD-dependent oxidoreductase [Devosia sp. YIM 151766]|uniref:NAD(P)/FAD-dependent oxidoreductase n=1 Tax=Devosia sp. YIM 151766 TaxID=3017325 RepID=UPI00255C45C5|nr:FAD-dependent oxidoreductase [Devosia sp. YIM 151766]WIY52714.1 FAD-dependent oxidoreductase [Devosia sp. YIM 151766]